MDQVTIESANSAFEAAKEQATKTYKAQQVAAEAKNRLIKLEQAEAAKAAEYGAPPDKIQKILLEKTKDAREEATAAALVADDEAHKLRLIHYELDRIRTVAELMKIRQEAG